MTDQTADILGLLAGLLPQGEAMLAMRHDVSEATLAGYVEAVAVDQGGRHWLLGWSQDRLGDAFGLMVLERQRHAGAMVLARFPRDDIPEGCSGFLGLLQADWQAAHSAPVPVFMLAVPGGAHLRISGEALRQVDLQVMSGIVEATRKASHSCYFLPLAEALAAPESWVPGLVTAEDPVSNLGVDTIVALPGLGYMVEGWVLSPARPVTGFTLRAGDTICHADPRATYRMARPDLDAAFPQQAGLGRDAGFVAFFPMRDARPEGGDLLLRLHCGDARQSQHRLDPARIAWLHRGVGEAALLRCYPALEHEPFFPAMAATLKRYRMLGRAAPVGWQITPAERLLVLGVQEGHDDAYRIAAQIMTWRQTLFTQGIGVALLAPEATRAHMLPLFRELLAVADMPGLSLFFMTPPFCPREVAAALVATGASRFALLRPGFRADLEDLLACLDMISSDPEAPARACLALADGPSGLTGLEGAPGLGGAAGGFVDLARRGEAWADLPEGEVAGLALRASPRPVLPPLWERIERRGVAL